MHIIPIQSTQQQQVVTATDELIHYASILLDHSFESVSVKFDLKGRAAGMYKVRNHQRMIRYNPYLFAKYYDENLSVTVPHEVAHYLVDVLYGMRNALPHGREWKEIMGLFKADDSVTGCYNLDGIPVRHYKIFNYICGCRSHLLTSIRHNRVLQGIRYHCHYCKQILALSVA